MLRKICHKIYLRNRRIKMMHFMICLNYQPLHYTGPYEIIIRNIFPTLPAIFGLFFFLLCCTIIFMATTQPVCEINTHVIPDRGSKRSKFIKINVINFYHRNIHWFKKKTVWNAFDKHFYFYSWFIRNLHSQKSNKKKKAGAHLPPHLNSSKIH